MDVQSHIKEFVEKISDNKIEIYNEASIQYELAIFLREKLFNYKIQLERNVHYFGLNKSDFEKKEMDIVIFDKDKKEKLAIEIKFPVNGQYPEQMFKFCKDIKFLEELKAEGFKNNLFIAFANHPNFWKSSGKNEGIYTLFRFEKKLYGKIRKPTRPYDKVINLNGSYSINWEETIPPIRYFIIKV
jgi:hypothetical protein